MFAPAIAQRIMDRLLHAIPGTVVHLDDILITGRSKDHLENLQTALHQLAQTGLRLKQQKCLFMQMEVQYLGH